MDQVWVYLSPANVSDRLVTHVTLLSPTVCTLHGGDIGVSSKEGEGSTFGFFFKVRRAVGTSEERPSAGSRSNSETSNASNRDSTPGPRRPPFSRGNSNLQSIKERQNERPGMQPIASHSGVDTEQVESSKSKESESCFDNPPTEYFPESHPDSHEDDRYKETEKVTKNILEQQPQLEKKLPNLRKGETGRQEKDVKEISRSQSDQRSEEKQTLLLVEDNLINQKVLRRQLQSRGFEVFTANNGQEAIDAVAERGQIPNDDPHNRNFFDCILMDQEMPIKDGNAATQEIRQLQEEGKAGYSRILGVSANVREAQTNSMREAGMDDVISKPFKVDDLVTKVRSLVLGNENGKHDGESEQSNDKHKDSDATTKKRDGNKGAKDVQKDAAMEAVDDQRLNDRLHPDKASTVKKNDSQPTGREGSGRGGERSRSRQTRT